LEIRSWFRIRKGGLTRFGGRPFFIILEPSFPLSSGKEFLCWRSLEYDIVDVKFAVGEIDEEVEVDGDGKKGRA
jgi:hypothetical protein